MHKPEDLFTSYLTLEEKLDLLKRTLERNNLIRKYCIASPNKHHIEACLADNMAKKMEAVLLTTKLHEKRNALLDRIKATQNEIIKANNQLLEIKQRKQKNFILITQHRERIHKSRAKIELANKEKTSRSAMDYSLQKRFINSLIGPSNNVLLQKYGIKFNTSSLSITQQVLCDDVIRCITILHNAVVRGACSDIDLLIFHGMPIDIQNLHGWTSLHIAVWCERTNVIKFLIQKGANPSIKDKLGNLPDYYTDDRNIVTLLEEARKKYQNLRSSNQTKRLETHSPQQAFSNLNGMTPLHLAALRGDYEFIQNLLLIRTNDIDTPNFNGETALHQAVKFYINCKTANANKIANKIINLLLENGADMKFSNNVTKSSPYLLAELFDKSDVFDKYIEQINLKKKFTV